MPDYDESFPHQQAGIERGKDRLPEKSRAADLERQPRDGHQNGRQADRAGHHRILRYLLQRFRWFHSTPTWGLAQKPFDWRAKQKRQPRWKWNGTERTDRNCHRRDRTQEKGTESGITVIQHILWVLRTTHSRHLQWKQYNRDRHFHLPVYDERFLSRWQPRQDAERKHGQFAVWWDLHCLWNRFHKRWPAPVPLGDTHHHGRVPAKDAYQEEPQSPGHWGGMESHSQPSYGRIHQIHV